MSFSSKVKEELLNQTPAARQSQIAEFSAIFSVFGRICPEENGQILLKIHTENLTVAKKSFILLNVAFRTGADFCVRRHRTAAKRTSYDIILHNKKDITRILKALKYMDDGGLFMGKRDIFPYRLVQNTCCKRAFLRGIFLAAGSVTSPDKGYHLEIALGDKDFCERLRDLVADFNIEGKIVERKKYYVMYVKEGSAIVDFLNVIGAHVALMELENVRIVKELRNNVNRQVNCETANIQKTVSAAKRQIDDIKYIKEKLGFTGLNDMLKEVAILRLENPDVTLAELGQMLSKPLGKSGVNHRLRKLSNIADELRGNSSHN